MGVETDDRYAVAREALARIPHGVAIVAAADGDERSCATGTAMYVSFVPPMIAIAEHPGSRTYRCIERSGRFSVSFLHSAQQDVAERAGHAAPGGTGPDKFAALEIPVLQGPPGAAPAVAGSIAVLWCEVRERTPSGDHVLVVGEVVAHRVDGSKIDALLRYRRRYAHMGHETSDEAPEGYPT